ncbi:hypothetical protein [Wenyingzhuangia sp. IMCC45467]
MKNNDENILWVYNYAIAYRLLIIFTVGWLCSVAYDYSIISQRPNVLYQPIWGFQKIFMPKLASAWFFYSVVIVVFALCVYNFLFKKIICSIFIFFMVLWLNAVKWNYGTVSHAGHIFVLTHLFSIIIPNYFNLDRKITIYDVNVVKISLLGVLVTYSMAGFWKFASLMFTIYKGELDKVSWLHEDAVELNAIVGKMDLGNSVSEFMMKLYGIPYIWEVATVLVFLVQLTAVLAVFNRKYATLVMIVIISFHLFNTFCNNVIFSIAPVVVLILLFPYHLVFHLNFTKFKAKVV